MRPRPVGRNVVRTSGWARDEPANAARRESSNFIKTRDGFAANTRKIANVAFKSVCYRRTVRQRRSAAERPGRAMKFLIKLAFWLTIVILLLPSNRDQQGASAPQIGTGDAVSAANAAVSDMSRFCTRQPDACAVGSQAMAHFGQKAQTGAKMLYDFLTEKFGQPEARDVAAHEPAAAGAAHAHKPSQNTLTPKDAALPWRGPQPRKDADAKRPA
jgi:hypothetical protein